MKLPRRPYFWKRLAWESDPMRVLVLALIIALGLAAAVFGWIEGRRWTSFSETDAINGIADLYVQQAGDGAQRTDCHARPGWRAEVWLDIRCGSDPKFWYALDRRGGVLTIPRSQPGA
jgi:hypothetical protein